MSRTDFKDHFNCVRLNYKVIPFFKVVEFQFSNDNLYTIKFRKSFNDKEVLIGKPRVQKSGREINAAKKTDFKSMMPHMPLRSGFLQNTRYLNNKIMFAKMYETTL